MRAAFAAFFELRVVAQDDDADLGLFQVQRQAGDAVAEVDHLVEHGIGQGPQSLPTPSPISRMTPDVLAVGDSFHTRDLLFNFLK